MPSVLRSRFISIEFFGKVVVNPSFDLAYYLSSAGEGRIPNVEIRRMHSEGLKDTVQTEICGDTSFDKKDEIMVEDGLEVIEERAGQNEFISEFPPNAREDSGEDGLPLQLYVYGVRHLT